MRLKIFVGGTLLVIGLLVAVIFIKRKPNEESPPSSSGGESQPVASERSPGRGISGGQAAVPDGGGTNPPAASDPEHEQFVRRRTAELNALAAKSDMVSRDAILAELRNPDREIRKAALEASIQFSDRSVVPRLQEIAAETKDPAEKTEILEAIDYINLPSLTEVLAEEKARRVAQGITNAPRSATNKFGKRIRTQVTPGNP